MKKISIAIDGPSGAGKTTISKRAAEEFGFTHVDTGAIYRVVGLYVFRAGVNPKDTQGVCALLDRIKIDIEYKDGDQRMILNGEDVTGFIRTHEISMYASDVSAIPAVRDFLLNMQRDLATRYDVIMDGRDISTVVLPNARVKIFLTASSEDRAQRRYLELLNRGQEIDFQKVLEDVVLRDKNDSEREVAPLKPATDSIIVDTTGNTLEQSLDQLLGIIRNALKQEQN